MRSTDARPSIRSSQPRPGSQRLLNQLQSPLGATVRRLIAPSTMAVVVHHPGLVDLLLLDPHAARSKGPQPNSMADHAECLDTFTASQLWTDLDCPFHNANRLVGVWLGLPAALLIGAAENSTTTYVPY